MALPFTLHPTINTILLFLAVLGVLVLAHELGHFVTAKLSGIKVQEFGIGYPPRLFGIRRGETTYSINWLPLGGFVKMLGENSDPDEPRAFSSKSKRVRIMVLAAGSVMNLLLAPLLYTGAFMAGVPQECATCERTMIHTVVADTPASRAGLRPGDLIEAMDNRTVRSPEEVRTVARESAGREIDLRIVRDGRPVTLRLTPRPVMAENQGALGITLAREFTTVHYPIWEAVPLGFQRTGEMLTLFAGGIKQMVTREVPAELTGPVGIASETARAAEAGLSYLLQFTAFLSLNLAIFNMLPIPGLDGARLLFVIIEGLRRGRRVNPQVEGAIHFLGMVLLLTLMLYVSFNDVRRLGPG